MRDKLSRTEIRKDALQDGVTAATHTVGAVTTIVTTAVGDVARALGGFATEIFEIRDAARRAGQDHRSDVIDTPVDDPVASPEDLTDDEGGPSQAGPGPAG
jgi:hypothetical protein